MSTLTTFAIVLCCTATYLGSDFSGGSGTPEDPWLVATPTQLQKVDEHLDAHFRQVADIDLWGVDFTPIALTTLPDETIQFRGTYDGDGYTIRNLSIDEPNLDVIALFGKLGPEGAIRDTHVRNVNLNGRLCTAGLVGENNGLIEQCSSTGTVCGVNWSGGLVGDNRVTILDSYSRVHVDSNGSPGGLVGVHFGPAPPRVERCYAAGEVTGGTGGGLVGSVIAASPIVVDSYWDVAATGQSSSSGGSGRTTAQMQQRATFEPAWDFQSLWMVNEGIDYPVLQSTGEVLGDLTNDGKVNGADLTVLLALWGNCGGAFGCNADLNGDLVVDGFDLAVLLAAWTF